MKDNFINWVKNKNVTILGLSKSGVAAANLLYNLGAKVCVSEIKPEKAVKEYIEQLISPLISIHCDSKDQIADLENAELVVVSPGVPSTNPTIVFARENGIPVIGEIELAYKVLTDINPQTVIIAITGSNGKSTTVTLVGGLLKYLVNLPVIVAGNIGYPFSQAIIELCKKPANAIIVLEISSFQLESIIEFRPHIACLLNLSPNHLDRHSSFEEYVSTKAKLFKNQTSFDYAVLNYDDQEVRKLLSKIKAKKKFFSVNKKLTNGVIINDQKIVFVDSTRMLKVDICSLNRIRLLGSHNLENLLAALSITAILVNPEQLQTLENFISSFEGLEHRLEFVAKIEGVSYYNDSKATTPAAVIAALKAIPSKIILIAGGKDKNSDYSILRDIIIEKVKTVILIGEAKEKIKSHLALENYVPFIDAKNLEEAVFLAYKIANKGDTILFSPGCASFDMFTDFEERGRIFKNIVANLSYKHKAC